MDNYRFRDEIRFQIMEEFRKLKVIPKANPMWYNQAKCDIYMGTGAGAKLLKEIGSAALRKHHITLSIAQNDSGTGMVAQQRGESTFDYFGHLGKRQS